jgi:hypothetical protein
MSAQGEEPENESTRSGAETPGDSRADRRASEDLAEGLELMLRAARKAMRHVDPANVEKLGRRALESIEHLKRERVEEIGRKAKRHLDPKRVEEIAEEAGRELLRVVERVAERVDAVVKPSHSPPARSSESASGGATGDADPDRSDEPARVRLRARKVDASKSDFVVHAGNTAHSNLSIYSRY